MWKKLLAVAAIGALGASAQAQLFPSTPLDPNTDFFGGGTSSNVTHITAVKHVADDFVLSNDAEITQVTWWGASSHPSNPVYNISGFRITIYDTVTAGANPVAADIVYSEDFPLANIVVTGSIAPLQFDATLTTPPTLTGDGTYRYWISIQAILTDPNVSRFFTWEQINFTQDDLYALDGGGGVEPLFPDGAFQVRTASADNVTEVAFEIYGNVVISDTDGDGLLDSDEALYSTNPNDPDSDDDGLTDGDEVAMLLDGECTQPLDPDSDDDTLLDGDEVALGTDPCLVDTDGDGLADSVDPHPTIPDDLENFVSDSLRDLACDVLALPNGDFDGFSYFGRKLRQVLLAASLHAAANATSCGHYDLAILFVEGALSRMDGVSPPPDWVDSSPATDAIVAEGEALVDMLIILGQ